ncbi:hypothetical protein Fmac_025609 [Flemingia macrophylla]|uniref:Uncharacterized protein n=1 Tax=Flemingia macrophylla TaxID=520843 RepID=A0ABD1LSQ4_9FABA
MLCIDVLHSLVLFTSYVASEMHLILTIWFLMTMLMNMFHPRKILIGDDEEDDDDDDGNFGLGDLKPLVFLCAVNLRICVL